MSDPRSMGDLFRERRAAAASRNAAGNNSSRPGAPRTGTQPMTFAEIQWEQQQQQRQQQRLQQQREQHPVDEFGRLVRPSGSGHGNPRSLNSGSPHQYGNAPNSGRRGTNNGRGGRQNHRANLPIEQGVIHTLLDKFGFILCADRDKELFFHYSEFREGHSDELNIGDEVEFRVGRAEERGGRRGGGGSSGDSEKMSAFDVRKLPEGTIYWEKEDEPVGKRWRGSVDMVAREDHQRGQRGGMRDRHGGSKNPAAEGVIRIADGDGGGDDLGENLEIRYTPSDFVPAKPGQNRLDRKDIVDFTLVTERRTGKKYARNIALIQSERERQREEREGKLLKDAPLERGKVVGNKGDYGFLRSTTRVEEVYFHVSHILPPEGGGEDGTFSAKEVALRGTLKEGQDVEFYVVNESGGGSKKGARSLSARKIKLLTQGSVKFEHTIEEGVTGMVTECPVASGMEPFGRRDDRRKSVGLNQKVGKIRLQKEIIVENSDGAQEVVTHISLLPDSYPGGTFAISRTGSEVGSWIRPGDVLLFDVVKKVIDGTCLAAPTKFVTAGDKDGDSTPFSKPAIRLIAPSLCGRAEGVMRAVHDNYGFIHLAERNVDAYLPLFEVFPADIMGDLVRNNPYLAHDGNLIQNRGGRINLEVGMEVSFDLSVQMLNNTSGGRAGDRGRYGKPQERESLRARRVQILPKGTVKEKLSIVSGVKARVIKEDPKQPFVGTLELEESLKVDTGRQRHPLVAKLIDSIAEGKYGEEEGMFHDVLSERDAHFVISMVNSRNEDLEWTYVSESDTAEDNGHNRKLCITRKKSDVVAEEKESEQPGTSLETAKSEAGRGMEEMPLNEEMEEMMEKGDEDTTADDTMAVAKKQDAQEKKIKKAKMIRTLRFDKFSFHDMIINPLGVGDVVTCDVFQSRRSGAFSAENITVIEMKERPPAVVSDREVHKENAVVTPRKNLTGFVTELVSTRHFGFITAVDEQGSKTGDHVFFHFKEVESPGAVLGGGDVAQDGSPTSSRSKKPARSDAAIIRKGDEVKFDVGPGKNGKLAATNISILPRGTLKMVLKKADNKAPPCTGFILMEPSHTSLANTPSHAVLQSGPAGTAASGGSRWDNVRDDKSLASKSGPNAKEGGVILLLSDPSYLFSTKPKVESNKTAEMPAPSDKGNNAGISASSTSGPNNNGIHNDNSDSAKAEKSNGNDGQDITTSYIVGMHLSYKTNSIMAAYSANNRRNDRPKRGDLVSFGKARGIKLVKDIRIEKAGAATSVKGFLTEINKEDDSAVFVSSDNNARYEIKLTEVVSCDKSLLKDKEQVDGILHESKIFGVCRTKDIYLASSFGGKFGEANSSGGLKERPKLNLTVKKELQGMGGQIMAQSRMAKGPDGTIGFAPGWTKRVSPHAEAEEEEITRSLSAAATEFVPNFSVIATSGFGSVEDSTAK